MLAMREKLRQRSVIASYNVNQEEIAAIPRVTRLSSDLAVQRDKVWFFESSSDNDIFILGEHELVDIFA